MFGLTITFWTEPSRRTNRHLQTNLLERHDPSARLLPVIEVENFTLLYNDER
jgi:hypothetical protein